jgi:nucleoside-triphosphatase
MNNKVLLSGRPGSGKTTVIERALALMSQARAGGFFTREIRDIQGVRLGFEIVTLDGQRATLAHIRTRSSHRVGKYGVDVEALDRVGVAAVSNAIEDADLIIIDEIGKMELFSLRFRDAVVEAIQSPKPVLATIMVRPHPFADRVKAMPGITLLEVTPASRDALPERIRGLIQGQ